MRGVHASVYLKVIPELVTVLVLSSEISINVPQFGGSINLNQILKESDGARTYSSRIEGSADLFKGVDH